MTPKQDARLLLGGFLILITLINLLQAGNTGLLFDEAYYWYFSNDLSWGYFDHPPMTALLVYLGRFFSEGELGVRLTAPFLYTGTAWLLWKLIDDERKSQYVGLFILFLSSQALLAAYGFLIVPDTPLVFFATLFLFGYQRLVKKEDTLAVILLGVSMAGVMYSKYHGVLLIAFVLLSNLNILKSKKLWIAVLLSLLMYVPHLIWLFQNEFAPVKYHLIERANNKYKFEYTLHYLLNCIAIGGLSFPLVYYAFFKLEKKNKLDKGLVWLATGVFIFFLISSFSRRTQAQWVNLLYLPLLIFSFRFALDHLKFRKWLLRLSVISILLLTYARLALAFPALSPVTFETHGNDQWTSELEQQAGDKPVIFQNSYREAAMYSWYTKNESFSFNDVYFRKNQYDLDHSEFDLQGRNVVILRRRGATDSVIKVTRPFREAVWQGKPVTDFQSYKKLRCELPFKTLKRPLPGEMTMKVTNPYNRVADLKQLDFRLLFLNKHQGVLFSQRVTITEEVAKVDPGEVLEVNLSIPEADIPAETHFIRIGIAEYGMPPGFQGNLINYTER